MQTENSFDKKDHLLKTCYDYNLAVTPSDSIETLENYLKAVKDEAVQTQNQDDNEYFFLENNPVYIGRYSSRIKTFFFRYFTI